MFSVKAPQVPAARRRPYVDLDHDAAAGWRLAVHSSEGRRRADAVAAPVVTLSSCVTTSSSSCVATSCKFESVCL